MPEAYGFIGKNKQPAQGADPFANLGGGGAYGNAAGGILGQGGQAGFFNPMGSPAIRAALARRAQRSAENQRRRSSVLGKLAGLDPQAQQQNAINTDARTSGQTADFLNSARESELTGNQDWARGLFSGGLGNERDIAMMKLQAKAAKDAAGGGFGSQLGGLVGMGAGAFLGGPGGAALGAKLVGGGKKKPAAPNFNDPDYGWGGG